MGDALFSISNVHDLAALGRVSDGMTLIDEHMKDQAHRGNRANVWSGSILDWLAAALHDPRLFVPETTSTSQVSVVSPPPLNEICQAYGHL
jgi:hypothetical protein